MKTNLHDHVVGRVEATAGLQMNTQATVYVDGRRVHFFEPGETGMNLTLSGESAVGSTVGSSNESSHALA